eukprot:3823046-Amphidinium_carterae.1
MFAVADSAHANVGEDKVSSQAGYVIGVRLGNSFHPLDVTSFKLREMRRECAIHFSWLDAALMFSDCLMKLECSKEYLRKCFSDCYWDSRCTDETRATKALLQAQRRARKQRLRSSQGAAVVLRMDDSCEGSAWGKRKSDACSGWRRLPDAKRGLQSAGSLPLQDADCTSSLMQPPESSQSVAGQTPEVLVDRSSAGSPSSFVAPEGGRVQGRKTRGAARV